MAWYRYALRHDYLLACGTLSNLQEELADESKNRQAAQARLQLMEQAIPKLHEDLKKAQEQLVQSRMEVPVCTIPPMYSSPPAALPSSPLLRP